jgi:hypothetical protein
LPSQNRSLRRQIFVKEVVDGIVQKRYRSNRFVGHQQRGSQQRARAVLLGGGESRGRGLHVVAENRAALAHRFGSDRTLIRTHAQADKTLRHLSIGLLSHQLVPGVGAPEIDSGDLEELARSATEQLDQGTSVGPFSGFGRNTKQQLLEGLIGAGKETSSARYDRAAARNAQCCCDCRWKVFVIHKCLNLNGNYLSSQFESREMGERGALV